LCAIASGLPVTHSTVACKSSKSRNRIYWARGLFSPEKRLPRFLKSHAVKQELKTRILMPELRAVAPPETTPIEAFGRVVGRRGCGSGNEVRKLLKVPIINSKVGDLHLGDRLFDL
jgi:hypothetical protein